LAGWPTGAGAFPTNLRRWIARVSFITAVLAIPLNLVLGARGGTNDAIQTALYVALAAAAFVGGVRAGRPALSYGAASALGIALGFGVRAGEFSPLDGATAFAVLAWLVGGVAIALPDRGWRRGQQAVWERAAYAIAAVPIALGVTAAGALDPGSPTYGRLTLAVLSLAGLVAAFAAAERDARRGYVTSLLALGAGLMRIAATSPDNVQAYTVPVALYLLAVGWTRRREPRRYDALTGAGAAILLFPPFVQSLTADGFRWALLAGAEALALIFVGLAVRRRAALAVGVIGLTLVVLRQTVDAVNALETWQIMAIVGAGLLAAGTIALAARDQILGWLERGRVGWGRLR
jgi:hypothetical protein